MSDEILIVEDADSSVIVIGYDTSPVPPSTQQYMSFEALRLDASYTMPSTPVPFIWDAEIVDSKNVYNPATGEITIPFTGNYTFNFMFNLNAGDGVDILYTFAQRSTDGGASWSTSTNSGRRVRIATQGQHQIFVSTNPFNAGDKLRFVFYSTSPSTTISVVSVPMSTAQVPAARLLITGYST